MLLIANVSAAGSTDKFVNTHIRSLVADLLHDVEATGLRNGGRRRSV
jgi:hypothetical protein